MFIKNNKNLSKVTLASLASLASIAILSSSIFFSAGDNIFKREENRYALNNEYQVGEEYREGEVIKEVSMSGINSSVVTSDGTNDHLYTWGSNYYGQLGLGDKVTHTDRNFSPTEVDINGDKIYGNEGTIKQVSLGINHSSVITTDGTNDHLYTWGDNQYGQLGLGDNVIDADRNFSPTEVDINGDKIHGNEGTIKQVSLGEFFSSVITNDGTNDYLYTWGYNSYGQLGLGDNVIDADRNFSPTKVDINGYENEGTIKQVSLGGYHSSVIINNGGPNDHLYTWGYNNYGQLGLGDDEVDEVNIVDRNFYPNEVDINGDKIHGNEGTIKQVSLGNYHSSVITTDGTNDYLYTWGYNRYGQLGLGDKVLVTDRNFSPNKVDINQDGTPDNEGTIKQVSLGFNHSSVITTDGTNDHLYTWGKNTTGQLGLGDNVTDIDRNFSPNKVDINQDGTPDNEGTIKQVSLGEFSSSVITTDGTNDHLYTWGDNQYGQLGLGDNVIDADRNFSSNKIFIIKQTSDKPTVTTEINSLSQTSVTLSGTYKEAQETNKQYGSEFISAKLSGTGINDSIMIDNNIIQVNGLTANTEYNDWKINITYDDGIEEQELVEYIPSFNTLEKADAEAPTITVGEITTTEHTATFNVSVAEFTPTDPNSQNSSKVTGITLSGTNTDGVIIENTGGDVVVEGLETGKIYDDWSLTTTWEGSTTALENPVITQIKPFSILDYKIVFKSQKAKPTNITPDGFTLKLMADGYNPELIKSLELRYDGTPLTTSITTSINEIKSTPTTYDINVIGLVPGTTYTSDKFEFIDLSGTGRIDFSAIEIAIDIIAAKGINNTAIIVTTIIIITLLIALLLLIILLLRRKNKAIES